MLYLTILRTLVDTFYLLLKVERKVADADDSKREAGEEDIDEVDCVKPQTMPGVINSHSQLRRRPCGRPIMLCRLPLHLVSRGGGAPNNLQGSANSLQMAPEAMEVQEEEQQQHRKSRKRRSEAPSSTSKRTKKIKLESEEGEEEEDDDVHHADMKPDLGKIDVEGSISVPVRSSYMSKVAI